MLFRIYTLANGQLSVVWSEEYLDQGNIAKFQMLSKKRLGESIWDVNRVIVDQLSGSLEPFELYIDDQNNEKLFWYVNRYTDNTAIMTANYYSDNDQWSPSTNLVSSVQKVEIDYDIYPISPGKIQIIGTKRTNDLFNSSSTLFSIDYR